MNKIRITLKKSLIGRKPNHILTIKSLGLYKINETVEHNATEDVLGKVKQTAYLLDVQEVK